VKVLVCHQLAQANMSWDHFASSTFSPSFSTRSNDKTTPTGSPMQRVISSSSGSTKRKDREEGSHTYSRGDRIVFSQGMVEGAKPTSGKDIVFSQREESSHPSTHVSTMEK